MYIHSPIILQTYSIAEICPQLIFVLSSEYGSACILVFDSLAGASRSRVVATLRDYLTCEYKAKIKIPADHTFDRFNIQGHNVKVPQQTNFTDCGLYLLQYVESFFTVQIHSFTLKWISQSIIPNTYIVCLFFVLQQQDPIKSYRFPIKQLINWFDTLVVTKKREDIANLIKRLMEETKKNIVLPEIQLPTENGKLLELPDFSEEHGEFEDEEELYTECSEVKLILEIYMQFPLKNMTISIINNLITQN